MDNTMLFSKVYIDAFGYELPPNVLMSEDLEDRLEPLYQKLHFQKGQLEALTGVRERRLWDPGFTMTEGAVRAGRKALAAASIGVEEIGMLVYGGVCRDWLEPATACEIAHRLGMTPENQLYDLSNACLGVLNGMLQIANAIELGQIRAGMVVSCESSRQIIDTSVRRLVENPDMELFKKTIATLTGGSGAVAVILTGPDAGTHGHRLAGGVVRSAPAWYDLCRWGFGPALSPACGQIMETDSVGVLTNGVSLGVDTFAVFKQELQWGGDKPDKVICHQVGSTHQRTILGELGIAASKDFTTFAYLGNIGTVSLPITAAIANERGFLKPGERVGFLGIGSGLNCLMLGAKWGRKKIRPNSP